MINHNLPQYMQEVKQEIEGYAVDLGLDFFKTVFQMVNYEEMNALAAYGGFPTRYPHWKFGMEYERMRKPYEYGLSKIYEMVINTNPAYAYLLDNNNLIQQKMVMAHVYGHVDFFKNNYMFQPTNRKMMDQMANHSKRIRKYMDKYGAGKVEKFIDTCLSLERLIDRDSPFMGKTKSLNPDEEPPEVEIVRFETGENPNQPNSYLDSYLNTPEYIEEQKRKHQEKIKCMKKIPPAPEKDVLQFLISHAPLKNWQRTIIDLLREEAYYFAPQGQTKILNEGWAVWVHSNIMTQKALDASEIVEYADCHSKIVSVGSGQINPYALGVALLQDVEERWNRGKHGKEFNMCENMEERRLWDTKAGKGKEKLFEIRKHYNDISFLDEFLTPEFCLEQNLYQFEDFEYGKTIYRRITTKQFKEVKNTLLTQLTNFGLPSIAVTESNFRNRGELVLHHYWEEGNNLDQKYAELTLRAVEEFWKRPVYLETVVGEDWNRIRSKSGKLSYEEISEDELTIS